MGRAVEVALCVPEQPSHGICPIKVGERDAAPAAGSPDIVEAILERQQPPDLNFEKVSKNAPLRLGRIAKTVRIPSAASKSKYIPWSGMHSGNEVPDVALLFPCSILTFCRRVCSKMCNLKSRSAKLAGPRNCKFSVIFPVSREFGRSDYRWALVQFEVDNLPRFCSRPVNSFCLNWLLGISLALCNQVAQSKCCRSRLATLANSSPLVHPTSFSSRLA